MQGRILCYHGLPVTSFIFINFPAKIALMKKDIALIMREILKYSNDLPSVSHNTPFKVLIATVLSQRTKDAATEKAAAKLFSKYPNAKSLAKAPTREVQKLIKGAGFYKTKAARIKEISKAILEQFNGKVPDSRKQLMSLPGVGSKTSACTVVYAFGKPAICVDVHVHRISNRIGIVDTKKPDETEAELNKIIPKKYWLSINHSMVRFGQETCRPRNPKHQECALQKQCDFFNRKGKWAQS